MAHRPWMEARDIRQNQVILGAARRFLCCRAQIVSWEKSMGETLG